MSAVLVSKENNRAVFTAEIPAEEFLAAIDTAYRKNRNYFSLPGFRKGKAPRRLLEANYGEGIFYEDALNEILPKAFEAGVEELELHPVAQPDVDVDEIERGKDVKVKFSVDLMPVPVLGDYKGAKVEIPRLAATDEQVDRKLNEEREANARVLPVEDRAAQEGDVAVIDFEGFVDDEPFEGGKGDDFKLTLGSGQFVPGFEEQVVGHTVGESFDVNVTFPEQYHPDLAGKDARFAVTIKELQQVELPELDDEFAKDVSEFDTLEEYKDSIRQAQQEELDRRARIEKENAALDKLIELSELDIPDSMVAHQIDHEMEDMTRDMANMGLTMEQYMSMLNMDEDAVRASLAPRAKKHLQGELLLDQLKKDLELEASEEEIDAKIEEISAGVEDAQREEYVKYMKENRQQLLADSVKTQKAIEALIGAMEFVEVDTPVQQEEASEEEVQED